MSYVRQFHTCMNFPFLFFVVLGAALIWIPNHALAEDVPAPPPPETILLWEKDAPIGGGKFAKSDASIFVHRPAKANGTVVVVCPGGGYGGLVMGPEGHHCAKWLNTLGITGVVLRYRLPRQNHSLPILDAQRAIRLVRVNANKWGCDPKKVGIMGFSAGGHLASTAVTHFDAGDASAEDPISKQSCRPDFGVFIYPVITMIGEHCHGGSRKNFLGPAPSQELLDLYSNEKQVQEKTPPCFLAHAKDDHMVHPENSRMFAAALKEKNVPGEYLELPSGGHGLNGYKGPMWEAWKSALQKWMVASNLMPENQN